MTLHIPKMVYYNADADNFYRADTRKGLGSDFYRDWVKFKGYFSESAEAVLRRDKMEADDA